MSSLSEETDQPKPKQQWLKHPYSCSSYYTSRSEKLYPILLIMQPNSIIAHCQVYVHVILTRLFTDSAHKIIKSQQLSKLYPPMKTMRCHRKLTFISDPDLQFYTFFVYQLPPIIKINLCAVFIHGGKMTDTDVIMNQNT